MTSDLNLINIIGISEKEAAEKLKADGYNELPSTKKRSIFAIAFEVIREPMFLLLAACGTIYLILGDIKEALILLGFVFVVIGITLYQERKTERALESLRDLSSPRAVVVRDGELKRIPGREIVCGDTVVIAEGDRIPADAMLISCINLSVDESLLTGESVPVRKVSCANDISMGRPGGDDLPFVYSGTMVVQGRGIAHVQAIGMNTEIGKIGRALQTIETEETPLQKETECLVRNLAVFGILLCTVAVVVYGMTRGDWIKGILAGITLAMAMLPEEFPVVLTIFLALGAWRISQKQVLTRRMPVVETLGAATVLCVDKTGTLTLNRMTVSKIFTDGTFYDLTGDIKEPIPETFHQLIEFAILASQKDPFDPMEKALKQVGDDYLNNTEHIHNDWTLVREYPLSKGLLAISNVMKKSDVSNELVIAAKGAPEAIVDLCHLDETYKQQVAEHVRTMAKEGLRVLGVAKASFEHAALPGEQHDFEFKFLGLLGFTDPVRPGVPPAVKECYSAGVRVVMITGDYPDTARSIARQIGISPSDECITGAELETMKDDELCRRIQTVNIFARVVPEQKLRLVNALKSNGEVVAMTGDGVNDAPALKSAHIGIAMGGRGTDVARESADLVLTDDDFASIVQAIKMGRRIFDNLKKAMAYIFAIHIPIAGMSLIPILFKLPMVLFPVHIALLELIIDPSCSIVFEAESEEPDVMQRPPRRTDEPLFSYRMIGLSILQGISVLAIILCVYLIALNRGQGENEARALTFTALIIANLGLFLTNRSWSHSILATLRRPNSALWWVSGGALTFLGLVLYVPFLRNLCKLSILHPLDLGICFAAGVISIIWFEGFKMVQK